MAEQSSGTLFTVSLKDVSDGTETSLGTLSYNGTYYINNEYGSTAVVSYVAVRPGTGEEGP